MKILTFIDGHAPSFKSLSASSLAGLMSLASVGAYASTKSATEVEVNTPIEALIPMAKDYVANNNIDADSSLTINNSKELAKLLSGTLSNSIEDLTAEDVSNKLKAKDADKIFTTFMTTNNSEQAQKNAYILNSGISNITETYAKIQKNLAELYSDVDDLAIEISDVCSYHRDFVSYEEIEDYDKLYIAIDNLDGALDQAELCCDNITGELNNLNENYKNTAGQDNNQVLQQQEYVANLKSFFKNYRVTDEYYQDARKAFNKMDDILFEVYDLQAQYKKLEKNDINLLQALLKKQTEFNEDGKSSAEEQAASKDLLNKLVENASPMTRNYIIRLAEEEYKPENDPTGIEDVVVSTKVKGNVYKTATGIYRLDGQSVTVYDYSGRLLRTEPLDLKIHTGFTQ